VLRATRIDTGYPLLTRELRPCRCYRSRLARGSLRWTRWTASLE